MSKKTVIREVVGFRGEKIFELLITEYSNFKAPLFRPGFLGDKWPSIDYYIELRGLRKDRLFLLAQVKATKSILNPADLHIRIAAKKGDINQLRMMPGPTYVFGVHEPSERVFVQAVHAGTPVKSISRISTQNELTPVNLRKLYDEVRNFWRSKSFKPSTSNFL